MPSCCAYLVDKHGRHYIFDAGPIEAESEEDAMKIVMGASLWLSPEESLQSNTLDLIRRFDEQADRHDELGSAASVVGGVG
jgi:hypothetical protein